MVTSPDKEAADGFPAASPNIIFADSNPAILPNVTALSAIVTAPAFVMVTSPDKEAADGFPLASPNIIFADSNPAILFNVTALSAIFKVVTALSAIVLPSPLESLPFFMLSNSVAVNVVVPTAMPPSFIVNLSVPSILKIICPLFSVSSEVEVSNVILSNF